MNIRRITAAIAAGFLAAMALPAIASAATTVVVTPHNTQGWSTADTRPGGSVTFVADSDAPLGEGALQLTTDATTTAKAQYLHDADVALDAVTELSYYTKQVSGPPHADPSYQLLVDLNGATTGGFTTFVYEPYQNGVVTPGVWQQWDVDQGTFWSSRSFTDGGTCTVLAGGGGAPFYMLQQLQTMCPDAVAVGFGVNIGSNNPGYVVRTDAVVFNGTTYNFELVNQPSSKDACKKDGYKNYTDAEGAAFKNQGACVSHAARGENS